MLLSLSLTCFASKRPLRHLLCQALRFVVSFVDCHFASGLSLAHLLGEVSPSAASYDDGRSADLLLRRLFAESYLPSPTGSVTHTHDWPYVVRLSLRVTHESLSGASNDTFSLAFAYAHALVVSCKNIA